ncbi:MFS transporter [Philodulcilactobacillus myokoensis]|uniref:Di-/tripeptide transporter n=1 Tax=Philodulcilactobacillus myokoensis TaxID=2929573 RepID=A0A9W6B2J3_9LACO|nr:peptide MFS transporter [Philodulcilactobacillus myokoensis]GLB47341.1 MFS transporter [Philodulcilactobacillus myokoensis]
MKKQTPNMDTAFLGHPKGLSTLFFTEMWERFSYYGMRAILLLYMYYAINQGGLGLDRGLSMSIMSIYGALVYVSSVVGGYISDRILGSRRTVFYGGILIMFGHIALALPLGLTALFTSIVLITLGTGLLKPNVSDMVGDLYGPSDTRRDAGFTIFTFGINLGALIAPIVVGWLGQNVNFHLGFSLAAIGMFFGLFQYVVEGKKTLSQHGMKPGNPIQSNELRGIITKVILGIIALAVIIFIMSLNHALNIANIITLITIITLLLTVVYFVIMLTSKKVDSVERSHVWAYIPLFIASAIFWAIEEQGSSILAMFAATQTQNHVLGLTIPASFYQTLNPLFILIYSPIFAWLWGKLGKRQPGSPVKFSMGMVIAGLSYVFMVIPVVMFGTKSLVSPLWLVGSWAIIEIAEMLISPVGLSVTTKLAPKAFSSEMMSMWFLSDAVGQAISSQIVGSYSQNEAMYFGIIGLLAIVAGLILVMFVKPLKKLMQGIR